VKKIISALFFVAMPSQACAAEAFPMGTGLLRMVWALLVVSGIILLIYALAKKRLGLGNLHAGTIKVLELRRITPKNTLALIEVRAQVMLIGIGTEQITLLQNFSEESSQKSDFKSLLDEQQ